MQSSFLDYQQRELKGKLKIWGSRFFQERESDAMEAWPLLVINEKTEPEDGIVGTLTKGDTGRAPGLKVLWHQL